MYCPKCGKEMIVKYLGGMSMTLAPRKCTCGVTFEYFDGVGKFYLDGKEI